MAGQPRSLDPEELKDAFKRAAEIAAVVPPAMQDAAFNRALDQILPGGNGFGRQSLRAGVLVEQRPKTRPTAAALQNS
jgi:hypothetical protein